MRGAHDDPGEPYVYMIPTMTTIERLRTFHLLFIQGSIAKFFSFVADSPQYEKAASRRK